MKLWNWLVGKFKAEGDVNVAFDWRPLALIGAVVIAAVLLIKLL